MSASQLLFLENWMVTYNLDLILQERQGFNGLPPSYIQSQIAAYLISKLASLNLRPT